MFSKSMRLLIGGMFLFGVGTVFATDLNSINLAQCSCGGANELSYQSQPQA